jgi:uncharacterized protein YeaC (DUF1315 family)
MSTKQNDAIVEELRQQLVTAIELGERQKELAIREELKNSGLLSAEEVESLEKTI